MIAVIVQARMGSTRLPGKVLMDVAGKPMLAHVLSRVQRASVLDMVIVATTDSPSDDPIANYCRGTTTPYCRGSEQDVLDRYYQCAKSYDVETIVRVTADCPLIDPEVLGDVVEAYSGSDCDYASNTVARTYPDGLDAEVFSFAALERSWHEARRPAEREHVTPYIWRNPQLFKLCHVTQSEDLSELRWTVDEAQDLDFVQTLYDCLYKDNPCFLMEDIIELLDKEPHLLGINQAVKPSQSP